MSPVYERKRELCILFQGSNYNHSKLVLKILWKFGAFASLLRFGKLLPPYYKGAETAHTNRYFVAHCFGSSHRINANSFTLWISKPKIQEVQWVTPATTQLKLRWICLQVSAQQHDWLMFLTLVVLWLFVAMSNLDVTEFPFRFDCLVSFFLIISLTWLNDCVVGFAKKKSVLNWRWNKHKMQMNARYWASKDQNWRFLPPACSRFRHNVLSGHNLC